VINVYLCTHFKFLETFNEVDAKVENNFHSAVVL